MEELATTTLLKQEGYKRTWITCDYGSAIVMRVHENGEVENMTFDGKTMDAICKAWVDYKATKDK